MSVRNLMEDIVKNCLKELLLRQPHPEIDDELQSDIMAIALNKLPPRYVSTMKGEMYAKTQMKLQAEPDVYRELSLAIEKATHSAPRSDFSN